MKTQKNLYGIIIPLLSLAGFTSCVSHSSLKASQGFDSADTIRVEAGTTSFSINRTVRLPEEWYKRRNRLVVSPQLVVEGQPVTDYTPLVADASIYAKKLRRKQVLEDYRDDYQKVTPRDWSSQSAQDFTLAGSFDLPEGFTSGRLDAIVTLDGCAECTAIDTLLMAHVEREAQPVDTFSLQWMEPHFVVRPKVMRGQGEAKLQFPINGSKIVLDMGRNLQELLKMSQDLAPVLNDSLMEFNFIRITGVASADGSLAFNTQLAYNRALSASNWLASNLELPESVSRLISVHFKPEGWGPVLQAMQADRSPYASQVEDILRKYADSDDDKQEYYIRRLPCWNIIKDNYLQKDRKVEYAYEYTIRSFTTDEELLRMYRERPEAFNEEELLRVAELMEPMERKLEVYERIVNRFPDSKIGKNNYEVLKHQLLVKEEKQR